MEVLVTLAAIATVATAALIAKGAKYFISRWGANLEMPIEIEAVMSETDTAMIDKTQEVIQNMFGDSVVETIGNESNKERIDLLSNFASTLVQEYGLDIDVDVTVIEAQGDCYCCGYYDKKQEKVVFNIALLMCDRNSEYFEYCVRETIDTIIHELRHAVQYKAIAEEGFWNVDEERRIAWAQNIVGGNYIKSSVDYRGYCTQPIESDAIMFAGLVMKGVH